ncbi:MAG: hypothetical protein GXP18_08560 [Gammaproteobacteria bacterium]|nr:hypothetical protein [Gammaproteobacteria bacterium]
MTDETNAANESKNTIPIIAPPAETTIHETKHPDQDPITKSLKLLGEVVFTPGASLLVDGNVKSGIIHVGVGFVARRMFGLPGALLVGANSYSQSVTGKSLLGHILGLSTTTGETLVNRVHRAVDDGKPLNEIVATVVEDVEDSYYEAKSKLQKKSANDTPSGA